MPTTFQAFKYRIYPTDEQVEIIEKTFKCCRFVWNHFLERTSKIYDRRGYLRFDVGTPQKSYSHSHTDVCKSLR